VQFHWENRSYRTFDEFLGRFNSKRRHMLKAERAQLDKDGTTVRTLTGEELTSEVMAFASRCYEATVDRHAWNPPHLTPEFFARVPAAVPGAVEVVVAEEGTRRLACAFNLRGDTRLYGRHWGAVDDRRYLHFNVCYYHSIERSIALGLAAFEPGAGGEHKLARGFEPTLVRSAHWFAEPQLQAAMRAGLSREVEAWRAEVERTRAEGLAFRSGAGG
jgi:predicted N-acyltransferase